MIGAIAGDIIGSVFEWNNYKGTDFELFHSNTDFTDDSVLTVATAQVLLEGGGYTEAYQKYSQDYPGRGYGGNFATWIYDESPQPYNSWGNGSAMRVSPVGFYCNSLEEVLIEAEKSASVTHNHPEGIKGAQATALAIYLARTGHSKDAIRESITNLFGYNLNRTCDQIRPIYQFNESCQETVPEAIIAFLESSDFESAIRMGISLGGDSDTLACITGGIAQAYYKEIPEIIIHKVNSLLPVEFKNTIHQFNHKCGINYK
ncbi:ADP-ribosylglycohydrolase family protein [Marinifilum flexuosum]|uniref:ADP-ribosylglycohydrolase n=1 Tax=Marinifilum flexuosum TaxID=1117708 RepID=A0A419X8T9_9BACT|nr:ADP-ribosylglycohydrolase family protein [Marinifilum flexuosum]RKE04174.1 ADP-ribosylglycohydrolase [Marinifilum flexuosum]